MQLPVRQQIEQQDIQYHAGDWKVLLPPDKN